MVYRKVWLLGEPVVEEAVAATALKPGSLIILNSAGKATVHATAGGPTIQAFVLENEMFGKGVDDNIAADDLCQYGVGRPGDVVYGLLAAAASALVKGDMLESAGDGTLRKRTTGTALAVVREAVDNSAGASQARVVATLL